MANYVRWEQSGINSNVKPPINRGKGYVAKSATPYKQLLELDLPADFSGKEALLATQKGMEACYSGADQIPGILSGIGRGMTLKDNASYAGLMDLFKTTNQAIGRANLEGSFLLQRGYKPTEEEIRQMVEDGLAFEAFAGGPAITTPTGEFIPFEQQPNNLDIIGSALYSGINTSMEVIGEAGAEVVFGFASGLFGFAGDTIGGLLTGIASATGHYEAAYKISKWTDWGGMVDTFASDWGVNTNSTLYSISKTGGQIAANAAVLAIPGVGAHALVANTVMYASQSYNQNYRGTIDDYMAKQGVKVAALPTNKEMKYITSQISEDLGKKARFNAGLHAAITAGTTIVTGKTLGNKGTTLDHKIKYNIGTHAVGSTLHQLVDMRYWKERFFFFCKCCCIRSSCGCSYLCN